MEIIYLKNYINILEDAIVKGVTIAVEEALSDITDNSIVLKRELKRILIEALDNHIALLNEKMGAEAREKWACNKLGWTHNPEKHGYDASRINFPNKREETDWKNKTNNSRGEGAANDYKRAHLKRDKAKKDQGIEFSWTILSWGKGADLQYALKIPFEVIAPAIEPQFEKIRLKNVERARTGKDPLRSNIRISIKDYKHSSDVELLYPKTRSKVRDLKNLLSKDLYKLLLSLV